jgi:F-type H+-transporting ATPase subunit b
MDATSLATIWVLLGFLVFVGILIYVGAPRMLVSALDKRADAIRTELDEAQKLRQEAEALLAEYKEKTGNAQAEADAIVAQAQREAGALSAEAKVRIEEYVARRTRAVEQRIAQAESQAIAEVKSRAVDVAASAASRILAERGKGAVGEALIESSIEQVRKNLN